MCYVYVYFFSAIKKKTDSGPPATHAGTRVHTHTHAKLQGCIAAVFQATECQRQQDPACLAGPVLRLAPEGCWWGPIGMGLARGARRNSSGMSPLGGGPPNSHRSEAGAAPAEKRGEGRRGPPGSRRRLLHASLGPSSGASPRPPRMDARGPSVGNGAAAHQTPATV